MPTAVYVHDCPAFELQRTASQPCSLTSQSQQWCGVWLLRRARQIALLHLKPEPNAICQMRSPWRTPCFVSMFASTYLPPNT